jgi:hypothetical protein
MKIGWHSNQLGLRGTEVAIFDYAHFNETLLNNKSIIISDKNNPNLERLMDFKNRFDVELYSNFSDDINSIVDKHNLDVIFYIKMGIIDGKLCNKCKNMVQTIFRFNQPHGELYFYNSQWLANYCGSNEWLPHIVKRFPDITDDLKTELNIPSDSLVFGFYGGGDSFNIDYVKQCVYDISKEDNNIYFLFMNSDKFCDSNKVIFLNGNSDINYKNKFISTCDACLHARDGGETFGLTIAEFSIKNKPIICCRNVPEQNHISILKENAFYYGNYEEVNYILRNFKQICDFNKNYDFYSQQFSPENVMNKFNEMVTRIL